MDGDQQLVIELLDRWEDARDLGIDLTAQQLCADVPRLAPVLAQRIASLQAVNRWMEETSRDQDFGASEAFQSSSDATAFVNPSFSLATSTTYEDIFPYAEGGLGEIYSAVDPLLHRRVAIKMLAKERCHVPAAAKAFRMEAEIAARLDHPTMVPVYAMGDTDDGRPFYVMKFVRGTSLDDTVGTWHRRNDDLDIAEESGELHQWLGRFVLACNGVAYAHHRGIIHRDLKPAHILLGRYGETWIVDWGLAKPVGRSLPFKTDEEDTLVPKNFQSTKSLGDAGAAVAGTPAYMSPEQIWGGQPLDPTTDIYSLGVSLYKLVTGKLPFDADSYIDLRRRIFAGECPPPSHQKMGVDRRLDLIVGRAMQVERAERYQSAKELADDIQRFLADESVAADQPGARWAGKTRQGRFWRRRRSDSSE